jgi:hypothetical protein
MSPHVENALSTLTKSPPPITDEQEYFLQRLHDVDKHRAYAKYRDYTLDRNPIRDLCEKQYAIWTSRKAEFLKRQKAQKRRWPSYRAPDEMEQLMRQIVESWAASNGLTFQHAAAGWVVEWAIDVFTRWDSTPENRQLFPKPDHLQVIAPLMLSDPLLEYLMIPMTCPYRKVGERHIEFSRRVNRAVGIYMNFLKKNWRQRPAVMPREPKKSSFPRAGRKRQYIDHLSLALRICGVPLKQIQGVLEEMWGPRSLSMISRGAAKVARSVQLDLPD